MLGTTKFTAEHVCEISFRLLNIFGERIALDREKEEEEEEKEETRSTHFYSFLVKVKLKK